MSAGDGGHPFRDEGSAEKMARSDLIVSRQQAFGT